MPARIENLRSRLGNSYTYWREMIIYSISILLFISAFVVPFFLAAQVSPSFRILFLFIVPAMLIALSVIAMSFMKSTPRGGWFFHGWFPNEPTQWVDFRIYFENHRTIVIAETAANVVFFISLTSYILVSGQSVNREFSSENTGVLIYIPWIIMNGFIIILYCLWLYIREWGKEGSAT